MRFRNLGTKNAIQVHRDIIDQKGYVWAGWWAKPGETLPINKMKIVDEALKKTGSFQLLMADSDKQYLYQCSVSNVYYLDSQGQKASSPEPDYTPEYYSNDPMYIWFRIIDIQDAFRNSNCLSHLAFADYDCFPTETDGDYSSFNNSTIDSTDLVFCQRRTLMLLRDKEETDRRGIRWFNTKHNFSSEYAITQSNSILLISDLHFATEKNKFSFSDCQPNKAKVLRTLSDTICSVTNHESFASLIGAGDYVHTASEEEFNKADKSLFSIINNHEIDKDNVVLVPGNHDMAYSEFVPGSEIEYTQEIAKNNYVSFYKKIIGATPNGFCAMGRKILLKNRLPVEIVGLNSCSLQQEKAHFFGMGYVGHEQLELVEKEMGWYDVDTNERSFSHAFRILVLHHHLYPIEWALEPERDYPYSTCLDAVQIMHFAARNRVNLIIHGHKHQFEFAQMTRWTERAPYTHNILGMGSTSSTDMAISKSNCIGVLDFNQPEVLRIKILELSTDVIQQKRVLFSYDLPMKYL